MTDGYKARLEYNVARSSTPLHLHLPCSFPTPSLPSVPTLFTMRFALSFVAAAGIFSAVSASLMGRQSLPSKPLNPLSSNSTYTHSISSKVALFRVWLMPTSVAAVTRTMPVSARARLSSIALPPASRVHARAKTSKMRRRTRRLFARASYVLSPSIIIFTVY